MPATPKKVIAAPLTPTRSSRRLLGKTPELKITDLTESPSKSARKRAHKNESPKSSSKKKKNVTINLFDESAASIALEKSNREEELETPKKSRKQEKNVTIELFKLDDSVSAALQKSNDKIELKDSPLNTSAKNRKSIKLDDSVSTALEKSNDKIELKDSPLNTSAKHRKSISFEVKNQSNGKIELDEDDTSEDEEEPLNTSIKNRKSISFEAKNESNDEMDEEEFSEDDEPLSNSAKHHKSISFELSDSDEYDEPILKGGELELNEDDISDEDEEELNKSVKHQKSVTFDLSDSDQSGSEEDINGQMDLDEEEFANDLDEEELDENFDEEELDENLDEKEPKFENHEKDMQTTIAEYEQQNLEPRSWELAGEIAAHERDPNSLLQQYIEVDYRSTQAPVIDEDVNSRIESIIKQRIKDKNFDDVVRTKRVDESLQTYRARTTIDEIERKSLMKMYEDEYKKKSEAASETKENMELSDTEEKLDAESDAIQRQMNAVFSKLDALSHVRYRPSEIQGEPEVIVNKLAINLEEIGQKAVTAPDEEMLAPEEIVKHVKFAPKSKEERTTTDRLRERRKKKKKQKVIVRKLDKVKKVAKKRPFDSQF